MHRAAADALAAHGAGSGASPLDDRLHPAHASAERPLAQWKGTEAAVLLPSGYQANHAAVQTLVGIGAERPAASGSCSTSSSTRR